MESIHKVNLSVSSDQTLKIWTFCLFNCGSLPVHSSPIKVLAYLRHFAVIHASLLFYVPQSQVFLDLSVGYSYRWISAHDSLPPIRWTRFVAPDSLPRFVAPIHCPAPNQSVLYFVAHDTLVSMGSKNSTLLSSVKLLSCCDIPGMVWLCRHTL